MKLINNPKLFLIVRYWCGGKREIIEAHLKEQNARSAATKYIEANAINYIGLEITNIVGQFFDKDCN